MLLLSLGHTAEYEFMFVFLVVAFEWFQFLLLLFLPSGLPYARFLRCQKSLGICYKLREIQARRRRMRRGGEYGKLRMKLGLQL